MRRQKLAVIIPCLFMVLAFQNCAKPGIAIEEVVNDVSLESCQGVSCSLDPITQKPAVITVLLALGSEYEQKLVINGSSSQLMAETLIRYASPVKNPKILIVQDRNTNGEDFEDTEYLKSVLLARYQATSVVEPASGLTDADVAGYDLVWFNNPGYPMGQSASRDTLVRFPGGVVLQGDDMTRGSDFKLTPLNGLEHKENGTSVACQGKNYTHDNNSAYKYTVTLESTLFPKTNDVPLTFTYGNDIDLSVTTDSTTEVLATAVSGLAACPSLRPVITRKMK
jgi:hypothetical protein